jgi:hypothetical protein
MLAGATMAADLAPHDLVPFRWPAAWTTAEPLSLLKGSPINCLVTEGAPAAILDAARQAGLAVRDAASLGAAALNKRDWNSAAPVVVLNDLVWPRIKPIAAGRRPSADSAPTGDPWIDSNSWAAKLARARAPGKPVWLLVDPPQEDFAPGLDAYRVAIADATASGARWVVSLDGRLSQALVQGNAAAVKTWSEILTTLAFFEKHKPWRAYDDDGPLAILSNFAGDNEYLGTELLNLTARRNLLYRVIDRTRASTMNLAGLRAVLWADPDPPSGDIAARLTAFAQAGGLLIVSRSAAPAFKPGRTMECPVLGYSLRSLGKGSVAVPAQDWDDPYFVAADAHSLVGKRHDPMRLFSGGSCWLHYSVARSGKESLFQMVNFAAGRVSRNAPAPDGPSFRLLHPHRSVTLHSLDGEPRILPPIQDGKSIEYRIPRVGAYAALEVQA